MQELINARGGRELAYEDFDVLQRLALYPQVILASVGSCAVRGCEVTPAAGSTYDVAAGTLWLGGKLYDFPGAGGVTLPAYFELADVVTSSPRTYSKLNVVQDGIREQLVRVVATPAGSNNLPLDSDGPITLAHRLTELLTPLETIQFGNYRMDGVNYDTSGRGLGRNRGWQLTNGQGGAINLQGRLPLVENVDNAQLSVRTIGQTGGAETHTLSITEMPSHQHGFQQPFTDNSGSTGNGRGIAKSRDDGGNPDRARQTASAGSGQAHNNMPPFYVVGARQWMGL